MVFARRQPSQIRKARFEQVYQLIEQAAGEGMTISQVRDGLALSSEVYVRALLADMVEYNWLVSNEGIIKTKAGLRFGYRFFIPSAVAQS